MLKLAHHGSRNGTDAAWLAMVRPRLAVASLGAGNAYGHPHPETLAVLDRPGIPLLRTDRVGTIELATDGRGWVVESAGAAPRAPPGPASDAVGTEIRPTSAQARVDLNAASRAELEGLPGIGPVLARRIIAGRPYRSVEDLERVKGIGAKAVERLRPLVGVE